MKIDILGFFKSRIKNIDAGRESLENLIAVGLEKIQGNQSVDNGERALVGLIITAIESKTQTTVPEATKTQIKEGFVKGLDKANIMLVKQLQK